MADRGTLLSLSNSGSFGPMAAVMSGNMPREDALGYARSSEFTKRGLVFLREDGFVESWGQFATGGPLPESNEFAAWLLGLVKDEWGMTTAGVREWFTNDGGHSWPEEHVSPANLIAECADLRAKVKEIEEQRDAAVFVSKQLTAVLVTAGAPEFSSAQHAHDWATETAKLRAEVADCRQNLRGILDRAQIAARAESATPAKRCDDCAPEFGCWDGGEPCYKQPLVKSTPAKHPDTEALDWLLDNTMIAGHDSHIIDCRDELAAAMKGGAA